MANPYDTLLPYGQQLPSYKQQVDPLANYYKGIMAGGPEQLKFMSPEIGAASQQYQQAIQNLTNNTVARGGALGTGIAQLEAGRAGTIANLLGQARPWAAGQLGTLLNNQQTLALQALQQAQIAKYMDTQQSRDMWKSIGGGIMGVLSTPLGKGGPSLLGGILGKIPGLGGAAAGAGGAAATAAGATLPSLGEVAAGAIPSLPGAAVGGASVGIGAGGAAAPATGLTGALGLGGGSGLFGLGAATIPVIGGLVGGGLLTKSLWEKSQVHRQANQWVQGDQNAFDTAMSQATDDTSRRQYMTDYLNKLSSFARQGSHQGIVAKQALNTFNQWYGTTAKRLGINIPTIYSPGFQGVFERAAANAAANRGAA